MRKFFTWILSLVCLNPQVTWAKTIWIIAPEVLAEKQDLLETSGEKIIASMKHFGKEGFEVKILPNITNGFAVSYYLSLIKEKKQFPDYIIYYEPARYLSFDLEELILSDADEAIQITTMDKESYKSRDLHPKIIESLLPQDSSNKIKKYLYIQDRLKELTSGNNNLDPLETIFEVSVLPLQQVSKAILTSSGNKTKFVLFFSPERIRYIKDVFSQDTWTDSVIRFFGSDVGVSRRRQHELLAPLSLHPYFLPARFGDLHQREYLMENSTIHLNSAGIDRWAEFMGAAIADAKSPIK